MRKLVICMLLNSDEVESRVWKMVDEIMPISQRYFDLYQPHESILTIIIWLNTSDYIFAFRVMLVMCLKSNSPDYRYLAKCHVHTIHDSLSERFDLRLITMWRYLFWLLFLLLLPYGMRCAIVTSAHFQWISNHIANPRLDIWRSVGVYSSISFIAFYSCYLFLSTKLNLLRT